MDSPSKISRTISNRIGRFGLTSRLKRKIQFADSSLDCATNDACRGRDCGGKGKEEAEVASGRQARNEEARHGRLKRVVQNGEAVPALDTIYKVAGFQKRDTLQVDLVTGRVEDVVDVDRFASVESDAQRASPCSEPTMRALGR
jgi:hypothetical protein